MNETCFILHSSFRVKDHSQLAIVNWQTGYFDIFSGASFIRQQIDKLSDAKMPREQSDQSSQFDIDPQGPAWQ